MQSPGPDQGQLGRICVWAREVWRITVVQDGALYLESDDVGRALALLLTSRVTLARPSHPHEVRAGLGKL